VTYRSAIPSRQSSHLQTSLDVEDSELAESVESVRSSRAGGKDDGGDDDVKQAPAFSILATRSVSMSVRGLRGAGTTGVCVWTLPGDAGGGGGVGLLTSDVILDNSVDGTLRSYVHSCIHTLHSFLIQYGTERHVCCFERYDTP
jgi:hypothetical protein